MRIPKRRVSSIESKKRVSSQKRRVSSQKRRVSSLKKRVSSQKRRVSSQKKASIESEKAEYRVWKGEYRVKKGEYRVKKGEYRVKKASIESEKASIESKKASIESKKASIESKKRVSSLKKRVSSQKKRVSSLKRRVSSLKRRVSSLKRRVSSQKRRVSSQKRRVSSQKSEYRVKKASIESKKRVSSQKSEYRVRKASIESEKASIESKKLRCPACIVFRYSSSPTLKTLSRKRTPSQCRFSSCRGCDVEPDCGVRRIYGFHLTCLLKVKFLSSLTPRFFMPLPGTITNPRTGTSKGLSGWPWSTCCRVPMNNISDLDGLKLRPRCGWTSRGRHSCSDRVYSISDSCRPGRSSCRAGCHQRIDVQNETPNGVMTPATGATNYNVNRRGPNTFPWGTPRVQS